MAANSKLTRILSIDGGGIKGIIPGEILVSLEKKLQQLTGSDRKLAEFFDLIAGTSTGGILTCIYLCPDEDNPDVPKYSAQKTVDFYYEYGERIFHRSIWRCIWSGWGLWEEKYNARSLERILKNKFKDLELKDQIKPSLVTSYEINKRYAHFFTQHNAVNDEAYNYAVTDVTRATSAAPTYFETAKVISKSGDEYALVDGGVFANNPALCAYAEARTLDFDQYRKKPKAAEMAILSLGTGTYEKPFTYKRTKRWGLIRWVKPVIDIMMSGVAETVHHQLSQIFDAVGKPEQYLRIEPKFDDAIDMDKADKDTMEFLKTRGQQSASENDKELERFAQLLIDNQ